MKRRLQGRARRSFDLLIKDVVIAHPDGSMKDYLSSLELLRKYNFNKIGPGHGDFLVNPMDVVDWIIEHRLERERKVMSRLKLFSGVTSETW